MPTIVTLKYTCTSCHRSYADAAKLRRHNLQQHQRALPSITRGIRRYDNDDYIYVKKVGSRKHSAITAHFACPSCQVHYPEIRTLEDHIQMVHTSRKKPTPEDDEQSLDNSVDTDEILIPTSKDVLSFSLLSPSAYTSSRPKLRLDIAQSLSPLVTVVDQEKKSPLVSLKSHTNAFTFLTDALKQTQSELPRWLWRYEYPANMDPFETKIIKVIQFVLTDFASKCNRQERMPGPSNSERTFWVDRIVPLFQVFGDQTGLLNFQWCEVFAQKHAQIVADVKNHTPGKARFVDGIAYDENNDERIVMESSSGPDKENIRHTTDDTVKQMHSTIAILNADINRYMDASVKTMLKASVFGIHLVRKTMTLSAVRLKDDCNGFTYTEMQSCEIPTKFNDRTKWLRIFDFMCNLMSLLQEQGAVYEELKAEQDGAVETLPDKTVRVNLDF